MSKPMDIIDSLVNFSYQCRFQYVQHVDGGNPLLSDFEAKIAFLESVCFDKEKLKKKLAYFFGRELRELREHQAIKRKELLIAEILSDRNCSDYLENAILQNATSNLGILKSSLKNQITHVEVYSNPLPSTPAPTSDVAFQDTFVSFKTKNLETKGEMWYSMEKNGNNIILQQSPIKDDVTQKIYDAEKKELVQRLGPLKLLESAMGNSKDLSYLLRAIWDTDHINTDDHVTFANCPNFTSFVFEMANDEGKKWSILSDHIAMGEKFADPLLYAQYVDKDKEMASVISQQSIREYFLQHGQILSDTNFTEYLKNPTANVGILKSFLQDEITHVQVYTNPLPAIPKSNFTIHAIVVFQTRNPMTNEEMWWSLEKNTKYIVLQQSPVKKDVVEKFYDDGKKEHVKRHGPVKLKKKCHGKSRAP